MSEDLLERENSNLSDRESFDFANSRDPLHRKADQLVGGQIGDRYEESDLRDAQDREKSASKGWFPVC